MKKCVLTRIAAVCLAVSMVMLPAETVGAAARPGCCNAKEWEVLRLTNEKRMAEGMDAVTTFKKLQSACDIRAKELVQLFSHDRPNGKSCFSVLTDISKYSAGENISAGQTSASQTMASWWSSPGHKANILTEEFDHMGVGYQNTSSGYRNYWVQLFTGGGCEIDSISVNQVKDNTYKKGTKIKNMKRYVKVACDHGTSYMPLSPKMCKGYKADKKGKQTITVKYKGAETSFDVVIK